MRDPQGEPSDLIRSVSRALRVLESVGSSPRGLTVKQIARRCELTVATTYHLVRTLAYEGYVTRREDGTYTVGMEVSDRFRELVVAFRGPAAVGEVLVRPVVGSNTSEGCTLPLMPSCRTASVTSKRKLPLDGVPCT